VDITQSAPSPLRRCQEDAGAALAQIRPAEPPLRRRKVSSSQRRSVLLLPSTRLAQTCKRIPIPTKVRHPITYPSATPLSSQQDVPSSWLRHRRALRQREEHRAGVHRAPTRQQLTATQIDDLSHSPPLQMSEKATPSICSSGLLWQRQTTVKARLSRESNWASAHNKQQVQNQFKSKQPTHTVRSLRFRYPDPHRPVSLGDPLTGHTLPSWTSLSQTGNPPHLANRPLNSAHLPNWLTQMKVQS